MKRWVSVALVSICLLAVIVAALARSQVAYSENAKAGSGTDESKVWTAGDKALVMDVTPPRTPPSACQIFLLWDFEKKTISLVTVYPEGGKEPIVKTSSYTDIRQSGDR